LNFGTIQLSLVTNVYCFQMFFLYHLSHLLLGILIHLNISDKKLRDSYIVDPGFITSSVHGIQHIPHLARNAEVVSLAFEHIARTVNRCGTCSIITIQHQSNWT